MEHFYEYCQREEDIPLRAFWRFLFRADRRAQGSEMRAWNLRFCRALVHAFELKPNTLVIERLMHSGDDWSLMTYFQELGVTHEHRAYEQLLKARLAMSAASVTLTSDQGDVLTFPNKGTTAQVQADATLGDFTWESPLDANGDHVGFPDDTYTFTFVAQDAAGNVGPEASVTGEVDTAPEFQKCEQTEPNPPGPHQSAVSALR